MQTNTALRRPEDVTARARIRDSAFRLFAERGTAATSVRAIADAAGTSPALVLHHFGSKKRLARAVDDAVASSFRAALATIAPSDSAELVSAQVGSAFGTVIGSDPTLRKYLRRALLEENPVSTTLVDELRELVRVGLDVFDETGGLRPGTDPRWRPYQVLFVVLGPLLLEPLLQRELEGHAFDPDVVESRTRANYEFFARGLLS